MKRMFRYCLFTILPCALIALAICAEAQVVEEACGPYSGTTARVRSTTYYFCNPSQGLHEALDICIGTPCGYCGCDGNQSSWHRAMTYNLKLYQYTGGCANNCEGTAGASCNLSSDNNCNGGAGNYFRVIGTNGWDFRQLHFNYSAVYSYTKYARTGNILGHTGSTGNSTGPHVHADNRLNGVRRTDWYTGLVTCGDRGTSDFLMGYVQLQ